MVVGVLLYIAVVCTVIAAIGVSMLERQEDHLESFPPDVQQLLRAAGIKRVYHYVGRRRRRPRKTHIRVPSVEGAIWVRETAAPDDAKRPEGPPRPPPDETEWVPGPP